MIKFIVCLLPMFIYVFLKSSKSLHMLQQNWYNDDNRYVKWLFSNIKKNFLLFDLGFLIFSIGFLFDNKILMTVNVLFYTFLALRFLKKAKFEQVKLKLKYTKRVKRMVVTYFLLYIAAIVIMCLNYKEEYMFIYLLINGLLVYLNCFVVLLAKVINTPVEKSINYNFKRLAKKKLRDNKNLEVIGITGSYGKTSSKNILSDILNVKYNAFPTPKNYNTPVGLIISINNFLDKFNDLFIAEMGAFKRGEVKELCDLVHPKYGILTIVGKAHLDSFGSQENIQKGKFELIESLPTDGIGVLNMDDPFQVSYELKNDCKIVWIAIDNKDADYRASNIKLTSEGTKFDVTFKDGKKVKFETKLLGRANVYNILAGIALGSELKISKEKLQVGVSKVRAVEHRLELKKMANINIIDDAYNSNPIGSKMAIDVLGLMPGKKIVVTPGMIELGDEQYSANKTFGEYIAEVADEVILVGTEQTKPIMDGLIEKKYKKKNIHVLDDVKLAFPLMQRLAEGDTYVLLENDLPDMFNEK